MDNLNKQQVILVALLASFVTSIATSIITATLLEQAPPAVTQTINRVVERTIEQVIHVPDKNQTASTVVTKETIVVKEDEQIMGVIEKNNPTLVGFTASSSAGGIDSSVIALGILVSKDGLIAVYKPSVNPDSAYLAGFSDGKKYPVSLVYDHTAKNILLYKISSGEDIVFQQVSLADSDGVKLGQSVILLGGKSGRIVAEGIVSGISEEFYSTSATTTAGRKIVDEFSVNFSGKSDVSGSVLNFSGDLIGFKTDSQDGMSILPSNAVSQALLAYLGSLKRE